MDLPPVLMHYTNKREHLISILKYGIVFNLNSTELRDSIMSGRTIPEDRIPGPGMACFCEPQQAGANLLRDVFGRFGVAIDSKALRGRECRRVCYFPPNGPLAERLRRVLNKYAPDQRPVLSSQSSTGTAAENDAGEEDEMARQLQSVLMASGRELRGFKVHRGWLKILDRLRYSQTHEHAWESEWRVPGHAALIQAQSEFVSITAARANMLKVALGMLEPIYQRSVAANRVVSAKDRELVNSFSIPLAPKYVRWIEVPSAKCASVEEAVTVAVDHGLEM